MPNPPLRTPAQRLKYVAKLTALKHTDLARCLSIPLGTLRKWESGERALNPKAIKKCIAGYKLIGLELSENWLLYGKGSAPRKAENNLIDEEFHNVAINLQHCAMTINSFLSLLNNKKKSTLKVNYKKIDLLKMKELKPFTNYSRSLAILTAALEAAGIACSAEQRNDLVNMVYEYINQNPNQLETTFIAFAQGMIKYGCKCNAFNPKDKKNYK